MQIGKHGDTVTFNILEYCRILSFTCMELPFDYCYVTEQLLLVTRQ